MQVKPICTRTCEVRYFLGVLVVAWLGHYTTCYLALTGTIMVVWMMISRLVLYTQLVLRLLT